MLLGQVAKVWGQTKGVVHSHDHDLPHYYSGVDPVRLHSQTSPSHWRRSTNSSKQETHFNWLKQLSLTKLFNVNQSIMQWFSSVPLGLSEPNPKHQVLQMEVFWLPVLYSFVQSNINDGQSCCFGDLTKNAIEHGNVPNTTYYCN